MFTHSFAHQVRKFGEMQLGEEGREMHIAQCWIFSSVLVYCLGIVLAIYIKKVFAGFSPLRGFPRINVVYLVIVFLSMILSMPWLSSKLKRNLIITETLIVN